jgi:glycosyltransferase involved in cell wall biosynthesis
MAAGRPIIALDCDFNRELLDVNGFYYDRDMQSLYGQISYIIDHPSEAEEKARATLERVKIFYNWDIVAGQYEALFNSIINISSMK